MSIESTLLDWVGTTTGLDAYQAPIDTSLDKPEGDYATFQLMSIIMSDYYQLDGSDKNADFITKESANNATILVDLNVFSYQGYNLLSKLNASGDFWEYRNLLKEGGLSINRVGNPSNLTGLGDTNFVQRWQSEVEFRYTFKHENDWHKLKEFSLSGKFLKTDGSGTINTLINWPKN